MRIIRHLSATPSKIPPLAVTSFLTRADFPSAQSVRTNRTKATRAEIWNPFCISHQTTSPPGTLIEVHTLGGNSPKNHITGCIQGCCSWKSGSVKNIHQYPQNSLAFMAEPPRDRPKPLVICCSRAGSHCTAHINLWSNLCTCPANEIGKNLPTRIV